jgi:hypothetical protein
MQGCIRERRDHETHKYSANVGAVEPVPPSHRFLTHQQKSLLASAPSQVSLKMVAGSFLTGLLTTVLLATSASATAISRAPRCKCTSNQPCWPNARAFSQLQSRLSQPLITVQPIGRPCFEASYNEQQCEVVRDRFNDGLWRTDQPGAMMSANWEAADGMTTSCHFNFSATTTCAQGRVPVIGVNATTVRDVQEAVRFASSHNLKVVVKNTG